MKKSAKSAGHFVRVLASPRFFRATMVVLVLQATWLALSGRYPMAFDEDFHFGIIRLYAHHLWPFWAHQPAGANMFGAVARDPSYLYQYVMSLPYRFISLFTHDQTIQVLCLRGIDIALFTLGVVLFRRLLQRTGASAALLNFCCAVFVLIPVVPLLAAQINYDDLLLPLIAITLELTMRIVDELRAQRRLNGRRVLLLAIVCLLTSLVKYAFLPIFLAIMIYLHLEFRQAYAHRQVFIRAILDSWRALSRRLRWGLVALLCLSFAMFSERYAINTLRYHTPTPSCNKVLNVQACSAYGPWIRDYTFAQANTHGPHSPLVFTADWFYGMWLRLFFAVDGPGTEFETRGPLLIPSLAAIAVAAGSLVVAVRYGRQFLNRRRHPLLFLAMLSAVIYIAALWLVEYQAFVRTGQAVAINGRYLLPVLLPILVWLALAWRQALRTLSSRAWMAGLALLCLVWGGGALTYMLRSSDAWYWPNQTIHDVNYAAQRFLGPVVPGYRSPDLFL
ncbi:MAG TPA: hypothetical protein VG992_02585 [Candidatus Saccharimonadales bacterium]|nr:hypothetical protein [Candidatus Saccharimonadales bacterium]